MPRKSRKKAQPETVAVAVAEPVPLTDPLDQVMKRYDLPDPARQLPAPEEDVRLLPEEPKAPAQPRWTDRYKPMRSYPQEGVRMVEAKDHSSVGIAFDNDKPPTQAEKLDMQFPDEARRDRGFAYDKKPKVWEQEATPDSRDAAKKLADRIAMERREQKERERER